MKNISDIVKKNYNFSKQRKYRGIDPYDGLNLNNYLGSLFKKNKFTRLILIHLNKRSIFNFRPLLGIKPGVNPKALALLVSGLVKLENLDDTKELIKLIKKHQSTLTSKPAWGYYFDWQSRIFFQPADTPTIVATSFVCNAMLDLFESTNEKELLSMVESSILFFVEELNIFENDDGICFSYSPLDRSIIYNASALGLEVIARYLSITNQNSIALKAIISKGVNFIIKNQNHDGSWFYGKKTIQHFIDHYHTAYLLESLENIDTYTREEFNLIPVIAKGLEFYISNMFTGDFAPKYYKNAVYPIESHCAGAAIKALCVLSKRHGREYYDIAVKVSDWTLNNLLDKKRNYFFYQKRKFWTNKINYLRWSQVWMLVGLSYLVNCEKKYGH